VSTQPKTFITPEQYLEIERAAEFKSEYYQGEMFAMAGAVRGHNLIVMNAAGLIWGQLRKRPCEAYSNDMRILIPATGLYTYPDLVALCGERKFQDARQDTLLNPNLIIEVLSPTTEAYDRGRKFDHYRSIESLNEYLLISCDRIHTDLFTKQPDGRWLLTSADKLEDSVDLPSIGCRLNLADLYEKVELT
jgi:Uma2 family endonuclease